MHRVILHADLNNFYASVECLYNPALRGKPMAVAGDPEARHGIVLAKNYAAKAYGVATGNPLWMAKQKCPDIVFVAPHYDLYLKYSQIAREIYAEYTDQIEPFGLDENWLDVTGSAALFGSGKQIADTLRNRIKFELGVTISVGVSFNKIFAKLGSDLKKPDATTVIPPDRYQEIVWPLPVSELLYVGHATNAKLHRYYIHTIGDLAKADPNQLRYLFGKVGTMLWVFANGLDTSPVSALEAEPVIKSIGNSTTTPRDLVTKEDVRVILHILSESVSSRMRNHGFVCKTVQIGVRDCDLHSYQRQGQLIYPNRTTKALFDKAYELYMRHPADKPIRSLSVRACDLSLDANEQLSFLPEIAAIQREEMVEGAVDRLRERFGHEALRRGICLFDPLLADLNPKEDHIIHPESFFKGAG